MTPGTASAEEAARLWAGVGHEIRTPLMGVVGMMELLARTPLNDAQRRLIATAQESSSALMRIVDDVLELAKIKTGYFTLEETAMDVADMVENCAEVLARQAEAKGLDLICDVEPNMPMVVGDAVRLRQVLLNLGANAVKFTDSGSVQLNLRIREHKGDRVSLGFTVADTGVGIPQELQSFLFEPFTQLAGAPGRGQGGLGLGLAICRNIITAMGGTILLDSSAGAGTRCHVTVSLPLAKAAAPERSRIEGARVLLVHNGEAVMDVAARHLTAAGATAMAVTDLGAVGTQARNLIADGNSPAVILLGPAVEGEDVRALDEALQRIIPNRAVPLVWLYGRSAGLDAGRKSVARVAAYPLRRNVLLRAIAEAASHHESHRLTTIERPTSLARDGDGDTAAARVAGRLILVAEDNVINQQVLRQQLAILGFDCDIVGHGEDALKALANGNYRMMLCDCHMPDMDGFELTRRIRTIERDAREKNLGNSHLPIVAVTANALPGDAERCREVGMDDYLAKPLEIRTLMAMLERWAGEPSPAVQSLRMDMEGEAAPPVVLDLSSLKTVYGDNAKQLGVVLDEWCVVMTDALEEVRVALLTGRHDVALPAAHRIKGSAGIAGAREMSIAAAILEVSLKSGDVARISADGERLQRTGRAALQSARIWIARNTGAAA